MTKFRSKRICCIYFSGGDSSIRSDMNGAKREWIDHAEDIRYMKQLAAELDQFE